MDVPSQLCGGPHVPLATDGEMKSRIPGPTLAGDGP